MKLGILDMVPIAQGSEPAEAIRQAVRLARAAEQWGYSRYWVSEHHDMESLASACPEVLLAHIGAHTSRIRIGSGAVLLPYYKPYKVAEAFHLLATLHPGRIDLGVGRAPGGSAHAAMALSGNFLENVRRMPESLQSLSELLSGEYRLEGESVTARPVPTVPPELWLLGTNAKSARFAAQFGAGYAFGRFMSGLNGSELLAAYRNDFRPSKLREEPRVIFAVGAVCAETENEAKRLAEEGMARFLPDGALREAMDSSDKLLVGTPERVAERLHALESKYRADEFIIVTNVKDYDKRIRSFELLAGAAVS